MQRKFVKTRNAKGFVSALSKLEERGAEEACLMVVDGQPGLGKTATVQWWAVQNGAVFLRAKKEWSPRWMLRELLEELRVRPAWSFEQMYRQAIEALQAAADRAQTEGRTFAVVVDEVDHISRSARHLETLRDLSDMLEIPFILVGMGRVRHNLTRFEQIASRIAQYVEFQAGSLEDVAAMIAELCDVSVKPDLVEKVHQLSGGRFREVKEAITAIERFGKRAAKKEMGAAEMDGNVLLYDRHSGRELRVKA